MIRRAVMILGLIAWPLAGAWLGLAAAPELAKINNVVAIAGRANISHDAIVELSARQIRRRFAVGSTLFGAWCGLVVGLRIASTGRRRTHAGYAIDPMACVTCGRCWTVCPVERKRVGKARQTP